MYWSVWYGLLYFSCRQWIQWYTNIDTCFDCDENSCEGGLNYITECDHKHLNAYSYSEVSLIEDDDKCKEWNWEIEQERDATTQNKCNKASWNIFYKSCASFLKLSSKLL